MPQHQARRRRRLDRVSVRPQRRSEADWDRFAWALLQHAKIVAARNATKREQDEPKP